jgi:hypothetical protein
MSPMPPRKMASRGVSFGEAGFVPGVSAEVSDPVVAVPDVGFGAAPSIFVEDELVPRAAGTEGASSFVALGVWMVGVALISEAVS